MATCSHLAPNGEKSILYQLLEDQYGEQIAHDTWEQVRSQQFLNKYGNWLSNKPFTDAPNVPLDANKEPLMQWVESVLNLSNAFKPANAEQQTAIDEIQRFIETGNPDEWFTLEGKAGTGKTTIVQEALAPYINKKSVLIAALSHKAKLVLENKLKDRFGKGAVEANSIAGALGMGMDLETGKFSVEFNPNAEEPPISEASIIVIDEASMVNEEALELIMDKKRRGAKVIFLGDIGQLPPIREKAGKGADAPSPSFNTKNKAKLLERVRQGEESPILPYADLYWNNSQKAAPVENPAGPAAKKSVVTPKGSMVFAKSADAMTAVLPLYKEAVETGNPDIVKTVVYRNATRKVINDKVRQYVFGARAEQEYVPGDLLMFSDNYTVGKTKISNSSEVQVKSVESLKTQDGWNVHQIGFVHGAMPMEMLVLSSADKERFDAHLSSIANQAKQMPKGFARTAKWKEFWAEKARFAPIEYAYAITSHKSQGSTYDVVLVGEADIMGVSLTTNKSKSQSIYTAMTRARHLAIMMDGKTDHGAMLPEAMAMLDKQRDKTAPAPGQVPGKSAVQQKLPLKTEMPKVMNVWYASGENAEFSNLAGRPFTYEGKDYKSVEHAYQTLRSGSFDEATYKEYKKAGVKIRGKAAKTEGGYNVTLMENLVRESFKQNPEAAKSLVGTGDAVFKHTQDKGIWADEFPRILQQVRKELQKPPTQEPAPVVDSKPVPVDLEAGLGKTKISETEMLARIQKIYETAEANPNAIYQVTYEHVSDRARLGKTQYTSIELAQLFDALPIPINVQFTPSMKAVIDNSARRIAESFKDDMPVAFISKDDKRVQETAAKLLVPKVDKNGKADGFFSPAEQKEIVDSLLALSERIQREYGVSGPNALVKTIGWIKSKEQMLLAQGRVDQAAVYTSIYRERVRLMNEVILQLETLGLHTDDRTVRRILEAIDQAKPISEQEKIELREANPDIDPDQLDPYSGEFMEAAGRIVRDWSENTFELDPKDTASARIKRLIGSLYQMDRGIYSADENGYDISSRDLSNLDTQSRAQQVALARELSRKPFWYKDAESTAELVTWLQGNYPRISVENFLGTAKSADFDTIFREILNTLGDQVQGMSFETAMAMLDAHPNPTIQQLAEDLRRADQSIKNEFMVVMSKQYQPFVMALFNTVRDANGQEHYVLSPIQSNRYGQRETLIEYWKQQQRLSDLTIFDKGGNRVLDVQRIRDRWLPMLADARSIEDWTTDEARDFFIEGMGNILRAAGIGVTDEMMGDLFANPGKWSSSDTVPGLFGIADNGKPTGMFSIFIMKSAGQLTEGDNVDIEGATKLAEVNNPLYTENTIMRDLARLVSKYTQVLYSSNHRNSEGKSIYDWGLNTKLSHALRKMTQDFETFLDETNQVDIARNNWLVQALMDTPKQLAEIELAYMDGLKPTWGNRGTTRAAMSDREQLLMSVLLFQNRGKSHNKNMTRAHYVSLTHSDKTMTPVFKNMPRLNIGQYGFMPNTIIGRSDSAMFNVFRAEYNRIVNQENIDFNSKRYNQGKNLFYFIPDFNYDAMKDMVAAGDLTEAEFNLIWPAGQRKLTKVIDSDRELAVINKILTRFTNSMIMNTLDKWKEHGIVSDEKLLFDRDYILKIANMNGYKTVVREGRTIDQSPTMVLDAAGVELSPKQYNNRIAGTAAKDYAVNSFLFNTALSQLFYGDPAETFKKADSKHDMENVKSTMIEYAKRLAKDIAPRADLYWEEGNRKYNTITIADVKTREPYLANIRELKEAYADNTTDSTDAQELTTVQEKLDVLYALGQISSKNYEEMSTIIKNKDKDGWYEFTNPDHIKVIMQPDKPLYAGTRAPVNGAMLTDYVKSSSYALYPPMTRGKHIDKLRRMMEDRGIARANFESARKIGAPSKSVEVLTPTGEWANPSDEAIAASMQVLDRSGFGIQQEVPYDEDKELIKTVTQMNENITEGIKGMQGFQLPGVGEVSGIRLKQLKEEVRKEMLTHNLNNFYKALNIDQGGVIDTEKIMDLLANEARKKGYSINELQSVLIRDKDGTPVISTMFNTAADRFESLLMSLVNKISEVKMPGKSFVQASSTGYKVEDADKADLSRIIWVGDYDGSPLKGLRIEDGKVKPGQVIMPFNFYDNLGNKLKVEDFLIDVNGKKMLDLERVPKELLQLVGARIPNQKHSSIHPIEIVGFTPENMGDIVLVPAVLVKQMGGDFDVDKLFSYKRPYKYDEQTASFKQITDYTERLGADNDEWLALKAATTDALKAAGIKDDGEGRYPINIFNQYLGMEVARRYPDGNVPKHQVPQTGEKTIEQMQRRYFDIHWSVLTHKDMMATILKPLDINDLKEESKLLTEPAGEYYNFYDAMNQLEDFQRGKEAKRLVGASSWAVKFNARIQDKKLQLAKEKWVDNGDGTKSFEGLEADYIEVMDEGGYIPRKLTLLSGMGESKYAKDGAGQSEQKTRTKGDNQVLIQSEAVDNNKNRTLDPLNLTSDTYKAVQALMQLETEEGWAPNSKYWTRLLTQPILKEYTREMKQGNDSLSDKYNPDLHLATVFKLRGQQLQAIRKELGIPDGAQPTDEQSDKIMKQIDEVRLDPKLMMDMRKFEGIKYAVHQIAALELFNRLHRVGQRMFELEAQFNQDVGGAGANLFTALTKNEQLKELEQVPIMGAKDIYKDEDGNWTETGATYDATVQTAVDVVGQVFPYKALMPMMGKIAAFTGKSVLSVDNQRLVLRAFRSFVYTSRPMWWNDAQKERVRLLYTDSLAKRVAKAQISWGKDNPLLIRLRTDIGANKADADYVNYVASSKTSTIDKQNMTNGWLYMLTSKDPEQRMLGEDLLRYAYLTGGVQDATSFVEFAPIPYLAGTEFGNMLKGMERTLKEEAEYENDGFIVQFVQHNPNLVTQVTEDLFGKLEKGREYPESFAVPKKTDPKFAKFEHLRMGDKMQPFISFRSKTDGKWILYMANQVGESTYYTRVDTLGNASSDEYNGKIASGQRSIFPLNRSLAERVPAISMTGMNDLQSMKNNTFGRGDYNKNVSTYHQIGVREGGVKEMVSALMEIKNNQEIPQPLRVVAELFLSSKDSVAAQAAKEVTNSLKMPFIIEYDTAIDSAARATFGNKIVLNPGEAETNAEAAEIFLHELAHNRLQWLVMASGYDSRYQELANPELVQRTEKFITQFRRDNPKVMEIIKELDRLRYEALTKFEMERTGEEIQALRDDVNAGRMTSDEHKLLYALSSLQEYTAHVPTNGDVAGYLNRIQDSKGKSMLSKVWDLFARMLQAMAEGFGFKVKSDSILHSSLINIFKLTSLDEQADLDVTHMLMDSPSVTKVPTETQAKELKTLFEDTYDRPTTITNQQDGWEVLVNAAKKVHNVQGQRGRILDKLYEQADAISDALNRTHDLQERTGLRSRYRELRDQIKQIHQSHDVMTIAKVGETQLKWVDEVLRNPKPSAIDVSLALQTSNIWKSLVDILYGSLKSVDIASEFADIQVQAQKRRIELLNTKAVDSLTDTFAHHIQLTPLDFKDKLTDIDSISAHALSLARAKPALAQGIAAIGQKEANNRDEHIYRNTKKVQALTKKLTAAGLNPDNMLQLSEDGSSWGLVNRLSDKWDKEINEGRSKMDASIRAIEKSQNLNADQRRERSLEAWNNYWTGIRKIATFVDARIFFDVKSGARNKGPEVDKAFDKLAEDVGSRDYAEELVRDAEQKYKDYLSEREAMNDYLDSVMVLTDEEAEGLSPDEQEALLDKNKEEAMTQWLKFNSPIDLLNRVDSKKNVEYNSEADSWIVMAPKKEFDEYYDERYQKIAADPAKIEAYNEYKNILKEMISYLPVEVQRQIPDNFFPIVPADTVSWLQSVFDKVRNWDSELLNALTATDAEEAARLRPDKIPVMYTYPTSLTKDVGNRSTDMGRVLELFSMMALQHRYMGQVLDMINIAESVLKEVNRQRLAGEAEGKQLRNIIDSVQYFKDALIFRKPKELQGKVDSPIYSLNPAKQHKITEDIRKLTQEKEELTNKVSEKMIEGDFDTEAEDKRIEAIDKQLTEYQLMARNIYGSKFADGLISINQLKSIGYNPFSAVSNYTFAEISMSVHARGRIDYTPKNLRQAMGIMTHAMQRYWSFGSVTDKTANKIHGLMARVGIMSDVVDTDYGQGPQKRKTRTGKTLDPFNWQRSGDYFTKGKLLVAMMLKEQVEVTENGEKKTIPLWEAFNAEGEWDTEKYGVNPEWDTQEGNGAKFQQFRDRARKVSTMVFGNQDKNSPVMARKNWLWRLAGQFRLSWFPEGIATRFKPQYFDAQLGRNVKGRWRSYSDIGFLTSGMIVAKQLASTLPGVKVDPFEGARDRKGQLVSENPVDMENMRKNFAGLAWTVGFAAMILILRGMGNDREKKNNKRQLLINMLIRNYQDLMLYSSPAVFNSISGNFIPASQVIVDYWNAMTATGHYLFTTKREKDAFERWLKKMTRAGIPHPSASLYNKFETMMTRDLDKIQR